MRSRLHHHVERGSIFIWVMVAMIGLTAIIFATTDAIMIGRQQAGAQLAYEGQVFNVARAGLIDGLSWFRRQTAQPVVTFAPVLDLAAVPAVNDTDDPDIGLVRSFEIGLTSHVWGRYEVRIYNRILAEELVDDVDSDGNPRHDPGCASCAAKTQHVCGLCGKTLYSRVVKDVSGERSLGGVGAAWYVESIGYVYELHDAGVAWNQSPNRVLGWTKVGTELRRLTVVPPAAAALCHRTASTTTIAAKGRVDGGTGIGTVYLNATGAITLGGELVGTPAQSAANPFNDSLQNVFGMTEGDLRSTADMVVSAMASLPNPIPSYQLVFYDGNAAFNNTQPLTGSGILYVKGNLTISSNSNSFYSGLIYVTGNFIQQAPSLLKGVVIVVGTVNISGAGDYSEIDYDTNILSDVLRLMGQYRFAKAPYVVP